MTSNSSMSVESSWIEPDWPAPGQVKALSTSRVGGFSRGVYRGLNLASHVGDDAELVRRNRQWLRTQSAMPAEPRWLDQVHGCRVYTFASDDMRADAAFADQPGQVCAVMSADCLPVLFCNHQGTKVAAAHAGWRGLAAGVLAQTLAHFAAEDQVMAWLGPAIGPQVFEVGADVYQAFCDQDENNRQAFQPLARDKWLADIFQLARQELQRLGVEQVYGGGDCTFSQPERYFSYRRDGVCGRMVSAIWLSEENGMAG